MQANVQVARQLVYCALSAGSSSTFTGGGFHFPVSASVVATSTLWSDQTWCPLWVMTLATASEMSALPQKQTCSSSESMSAKCQKRTSTNRRPNARWVGNRNVHWARKPVCASVVGCQEIVIGGQVRIDGLSTDLKNSPDASANGHSPAIIFNSLPVGRDQGARRQVPGGRL